MDAATEGGPGDAAPPAGWSRESGVVLDAAGRFRVGGAPVAHEGLARALAGWIDRAPDGRWILRNAVHWAYLTVEGAPLHARRARVEAAPPRVVLELTSGEEVGLEPGSLREAADGALIGRAAPSGWDVRLGPRAALDLAPWLVAGADGDLGVGPAAAP